MKLLLVVVSGLPGSGKSTVAEGISKQLRIPMFSVDPIESSIIKSGIGRSFETGFAAYLVVETLASEQLKLGISVVIDAVSSVKEARKMWRDLSERYKAKLIVIECVLDKEIHKKRVESRIRNLHGIPEVTWSDVEKGRENYLEWNEKRLVLDTNNKEEKIIEKAISYIKGDS